MNVTKNLVLNLCLCEGAKVQGHTHTACVKRCLSAVTTVTVIGVV